MADVEVCPKCQREVPDDAPRGLCPVCMLEMVRSLESSIIGTESPRGESCPDLSDGSDQRPKSTESDEMPDGGVPGQRRSPLAGSNGSSDPRLDQASPDHL